MLIDIILRQRVWCRKIIPILLVTYLFTLIFVVYQVYYASSKEIQSWASILSSFDKRHHEKISPEFLPFPAGTFDYTLDQSITLRNITILMWTEYYHNKDLTDHIRNESPIPSWCNVTFDRRVLNQSHALVFHIPGSDINMKDLPSRRLHVPWVYFIIEAPIYMQRDAHEFNGYFNRTMSYRLDSDYSTPYGFLTIHQKPLLKNPALLLTFPNKTKLVAWMVSHCVTAGQREVLVEKLQKYIQIDIYGDCGTLKCNKSAEEGCYEKLGKQYLFYLSFENSLCKDYATEKFTNALKYKLVPIVYGGGNYSAILPYPNSFIDVRNYKSAKELADYLKYLNFNRTAYAEYFAWHQYYDVNIRQGFNGFKKLCYALQRNETAQQQIYSDMHKWWTVEGDCKAGLDVHWTN